VYYYECIKDDVVGSETTRARASLRDARRDETNLTNRLIAHVGIY